MKSHRLAIVLFIPVLLACVVGGVACNFGLYYATPETESAFLKSYTPEHVIDRFCENWGSSHSRNFGSSAGRDFVPHEAGFEFHVVLRRENWMSVMNALRDDAQQQLANSGAEVLQPERQFAGWISLRLQDQSKHRFAENFASGNQLASSKEHAVAARHGGREREDRAIGEMVPEKR